MTHDYNETSFPPYAITLGQVRIPSECHHLERSVYTTSQDVQRHSDQFNHYQYRPELSPFSRTSAMYVQAAANPNAPYAPLQCGPSSDDISAFIVKTLAVGFLT